MRIYLLITNKCNLTCSMCIRGKTQNIDMNFNDFKKITIRESFIDTEIVITGGEPTLHKNFIDIVKFASKYFKKVLIATNGTTNFYIEDLKDLKNLIFQISIDGNQKIHNSIRGNNSFQATLNTVEKFEQTNINYCIASVVGLNNKKEIFELIPLLETFSKMKYWRISYEMPFGNSNKSLIMPVEEWNRFVDEILNSVNFRLLIKKIFYFNLYDKLLTNSDYQNENRHFNCGSGKDTLYVYPNFDAFPCTCLTNFPIGNISEDSIQSILTSDKNKKFSCYKVDDKLPCHECKYFKFCNGGCIGMSYNILGSLGKGDIRCPILRRHYEEKNNLL